VKGEKDGLFYRGRQRQKSLRNLLKRKGRLAETARFCENAEEKKSSRASVHPKRERAIPLPVEEDSWEEPGHEI